MALKGILPTQHLECWRYFVLASRLLCKMSISKDEIDLADTLLLKFCCKVEELYGKNFITPNMHLHCHLKESLYNYGPVYNFWLYSYERYNRILEHFPSSNRLFEIQMMQRFYNEFRLCNVSNDWPSRNYPELQEIFDANLDPFLSGSLQATTNDFFQFKLEQIYVQCRTGKFPYLLNSWCFHCVMFVQVLTPRYNRN